MMRRSRWLGFILIIGLLSCGGDHRDADRPIAGELLELWPSDELTDWVSYGDAVIVFTITSETEIPEEIENDSALIGRQLTAHLEQTAWNHPSAAPIPETFTLEAFGWVITESGRHEFNPAGAHRMTVGGQFLAPIINSGSDIAVLSPSQVFPLTDTAEVSETAEVPDAPGVQETANEIAGLGISAIADRLAATTPDPVAEANRDLSPADRWQVVAAQREASG